MAARFFVIILVFTLFVSESTFSQILNAESLRKVTDTSGFSGSASLDFQLKRNKNDFFTISSNIHVQYKMNNHLVLLKNDVDFQKIEGEKFSNSLISHLRYNYKITPTLAWEAFLQGQYNKVNLINFSGLAGSGPRFKLTQSENYKFYLGTLLMYEYEEVLDNVTPIQRDVRGSFYISFSLYPTEHISIVSTTYYQPKIEQIKEINFTEDYLPIIFFIMTSYYENKSCTISNLSLANSIPFNTAKRKINNLLNSKLIYKNTRLRDGKHHIFLPTPSLINIFIDLC